MQMIINGRHTDGCSGEYMEVINPASGEVIDRVPKGNERDIDEAFKAAGKAFGSWKGFPLHEKALIMERFVSLVREKRDELSEILCRDNGKPIIQAEKEIDNIFISVPAFTEKAKHLYDSVIQPGSEKNYEHSIQYVKREPLGTVVAIIPFNFPSNLFIQKVIPSLLSGNCLLVLPPSGNPLTVLRLSSLLIEAGVPEGVLNVITAPGSVKEAAVRDGRASLVTLTGSTDTGRRTALAAAENLIPVTLELGGNDPFIVMDDADMELVINELFVGRLINAGQICCASKRFIIHKAVLDEFIERTTGYVRGLKQGDPMDRDTQIGCLINEKAAERVEREVEFTVSQGGKLLAGGKRSGCFFEPTVITCVTKGMDIMKDMEVFGPVIPVISFEDEAEALEIANNTMYGLSSAVFSENHRTILRMAAGIQAGNVVINGASNLRSFEIPFTGWKKSGIGSEGVMSTFDEVTHKKVITLKGYKEV